MQIVNYFYKMSIYIEELSIDMLEYTYYKAVNTGR